MTSLSTRTTSAPLLTAAAVAAPLWTLAALAQVFTRDGFDLTRHPISMLSNGDLGWIQAANFIVSGVLTLCGAVGVRRALRDGPGATWGPILLAVQGAGLVVAGFFRADPGFGFPPGTPDAPLPMSGHGMVHMIAGSLSFLSMIIVSFVLARRFSGTPWALAGRASGLVFAACLAWTMTGGAAGTLAMFCGVAVAWGWIAATMARLRSPS